MEGNVTSSTVLNKDQLHSDPKLNESYINNAQKRCICLAWTGI